MKNIILPVLVALTLTACESKFFKHDATQNTVESELARAAQDAREHGNALLGESERKMGVPAEFR